MIVPQPQIFAESVIMAESPISVPQPIPCLVTGGFDIEIEYTPTWHGSNYTHEPSYTLFSVGGCVLAHDGERLRMSIAGSERLVADPGACMAGTPHGRVVLVRAWYHPFRGKIGISMTVGGATRGDWQQSINVGLIANSSGDIAIGSVSDAANIFVRSVRVRPANAHVTHAPIGVVIGDSVTAPVVNLGTHNSIHAVASDLLSDTADQNRVRIISLAAYADTISGQTIKWDGLTSSQKYAVHWVIVQIGINDITQLIDANSSAFVARYQALIDKIYSETSATCRIFASSITPAEGMWEASYAESASEMHERRAALNDAIASGVISHATPITQHLDPLESGYPSNSYYGIDKTHPLPAGRSQIADAWKVAIEYA